MTITVVPVTPTFAAEVGDIDLSKKIEPADLAAINAAFIKYAVLIFPDQHLSPRRDMQRATVSDTANTCEQHGIAIAAA
jgi:alpha-ketoglutarate-dependent taurine dioxygenase